MKKIFTSGFCLFLSIALIAQVDVDRSINLTGGSGQSKITGLQDVPTADDDAANKKYVDDQIAANSGGSGHYIGELYGGGVIFSLYRDADGNEHGFIVDLDDKSTGRSWSANTSNSVPAPGAANMWNGLTNSNAIQSQSWDSAASDCRNSTNGGHTDWYLPALSELGAIWNNLFIINRVLNTAGGSATIMGSNWYWSSSERDGSYAWIQNFGTSYGGSPVIATSALPKLNNYRVRCIRTF